MVRGEHTMVTISGYTKKSSLIWETGRRHVWLLLCYIAFTFILNQAVIYGNDSIAKATDEILLGRQAALGALMKPLLLMTLLGTAAAYAKSFCANLYNAAVQRDVRDAMSRHFISLQMRCFGKNGSGGIMTKLSSDMTEVGRFFSEVLPQFLVNVITVITVTVYFVQLDAMLIVILFASYPVMLVLSNWISKRFARIIKGFRTRMDDRTQAAYDVVQGIEVGRSYNLYEVLKKRLDVLIDDIAEHGARSTRISSMNYLLKNVIMKIPLVGCYLFALHEVLNGQITTGEMLAFTVLLGRIIYPFGELVLSLNDFREAGVSFERLQGIYGQPQETLGTHAYSIAENTPAVYWDKITFSYEEGQPVLRGLSFRARQGETIAFVGGSGEGKSTILKLLCGFYQRDGGSFLLYGRPFEEWELQSARACFSLVTQNVFLFPVSIWENVAYGKENATHEEVIEACKAANIHAFIEGLPQGYDTLVGERGVRLSGGERQRISLARAFLKAAPILLLDEPTAAIDEGTEAQLQEAIARISKGRTVIIIAHRLSTVEHADCIYVVEQGVVAESGTHGELLEKNGVYARLMKYGLRDNADGKVIHNEAVEEA